MSTMQASDGKKSCGQKYDCPDGEPECETRSVLAGGVVNKLGIVVFWKFEWDWFSVLSDLKPIIILMGICKFYIVICNQC